MQMDIQQWWNLVDLSGRSDLAFKKIIFLLALIFWFRALAALAPAIFHEYRNIFVVRETWTVRWYWAYFMNRMAFCCVENKEKLMQALALSFNAFVVIRAEGALPDFAKGIPFYPPLVVYLFLLMMELLMLGLANIADQKRSWSVEAGSGGFSVKLDPVDMVDDAVRERNLHKSVTSILWKTPELAYYFKNRNRSLDQLLSYLMKRHCRDIALTLTVDLVPGGAFEGIERYLSPTDIIRAETEPVIVPGEAGSIVVYRMLSAGELDFYIKVQMRRRALNIEEFLAGLDLIADYAQRIWADLEAQLEDETEENEPRQEEAVGAGDDSVVCEDEQRVL